MQILAIWKSLDRSVLGDAIASFCGYIEVAPATGSKQSRDQDLQAMNYSSNISLICNITTEENTQKNQYHARMILELDPRTTYFVGL